jgi:hypothetical protein
MAPPKTYAMHLLLAGASLPIIAANLGHADTRMTERHYAHLVPSHVTQVIRATMPKLGLVEPHSITPLLMCGTSAAACHLENHFRSTWNRTGAQERGGLSYP